MQYAILEIPNTEENIVRPVVYEVVRDICKRIGLSEEMTKAVRFIGSGGALPIKGSTLDDRGQLGRLPGDEYITITHEEEYDENYAMSVATFQPEVPPIFFDSNLGVLLKPVYQRVKNTVSIKLVAADKTSADTISGTLKRRFSQRAMEQTHVVNYSWPIPDTFMAILHEVHRLRENNKGYNEDFPHWLKRCFVKRMAVITAQDGKNARFTIREKQLQVHGWPEFQDQPPKQQREGEVGTWSIEFTYTFSYDRVESMVMRYPIMVHNQLMTNRYYDDFIAEDYKAIMRYYTYSMNASIPHLGYPSGLETLVRQGAISVPPFDKWKPELTPARYTPALNIMLQVDSNNPNALLSLTQLGDWDFSLDVIRFLRERPRSIVVPYNNIFNVQLYRNNSLMDTQKIIVSEDLDLHYAEPLDERYVYHLSISVLSDITRVDVFTLANLAKEGAFALRYLIAIIPALATVAANSVSNGLTDSTIPLLNAKGELQRLPTLLPNGALHPYELRQTLDKVTMSTGSSRADYVWKLIASLYIIAEPLNANR